jgi:hypothetical protein
MKRSAHDPEEFRRTAPDRRGGIHREFWDFIRHRKKYWLLPVIVVLLLLGLLVVLGGSGAAPFIYTLF